MHARQCNLDNRPNKTCCYFDATALDALTSFARTPQGLNRTCRNDGAPPAGLAFGASRLAFIDPTKTEIVGFSRLTIRLSDAGLRRRRTKWIYPDHRPYSLARRRCAP
jgi:hypothetical protein